MSQKMRLATLRHQGREEAALVLPSGLLPLRALNEKGGASWPTDLFALITSGRLGELNDWFRTGGQELCGSLKQDIQARSLVAFGPLYRRPRKIWGIGLNYAAHAADLAEKAPHEEPA